MKKKNAAAQSMARKRWAKTTPEERSAFARAIGVLGGRPRSDAPQCRCGAMTLKCAEARRHKCPTLNSPTVADPNSKTPSPQQ